MSDYLQQQLLPCYPSIEAADTDLDLPTLEELVTKIKAMPPNPSAIHPAKESLLEYLTNLPDDPDPSFDAEEWDREWDKFEVELKAINHANDITEGRTW